MELFPGISIEDILAADWDGSVGWRVDGLPRRPEAFVTIYLDEVGYPAWVGELVPEGWD